MNHQRSAHQTRADQHRSGQHRAGQHRADQNRDRKGAVPTRGSTVGAPRSLTVAVLVVLLLALNGCRRAPAPVDTVQATAERGPLRATLAARPARAQVGDIVTLTLTAEAPEDFRLTLPAETDLPELPDAAVRLTDTPDPQPGPRGLIWRHSFVIEPQAAGQLEIPALAVRYTRVSAGPASAPAAVLGQAETPGEDASAGTLPSQELLVGPLALEIVSVLNAQDRPERPRDITGTALPPKRPWPWWAYPALASGAVILAAACYATFLALRRRAQRPPPPVLPEVWALRALARLEAEYRTAAEDWLGTGRAREYYYRLTEVMRTYIERKFGLAAPEMTTEEFLATLARGPRALPYDADRLRTFLEACDFVKYAALQPRREDADDALHTARAFVHATAAAHSAQLASPTQSAPPAQTIQNPGSEIQNDVGAAP